MHGGPVIRAYPRLRGYLLMRLSLPKLLGVVGIASASAYLLLRYYPWRQWRVDHDDADAELIARYRPAIERALGAHETSAPEPS